MSKERKVKRDVFTSFDNKTCGTTRTRTAFPSKTHQINFPSRNGCFHTFFSTTAFTVYMKYCCPEISRTIHFKWEHETHFKYVGTTHKQKCIINKHNEMLQLNMIVDIAGVEGYRTFHFFYSKIKKKTYKKEIRYAINNLILHNV